jgi:hypothetical protein
MFMALPLLQIINIPSKPQIIAPAEMGCSDATPAKIAATANVSITMIVIRSFVSST